jgi:hypothetical protein
MALFYATLVICLAAAADCSVENAIYAKKAVHLYAR